ncbi:polymorphic toxin-type HINT domain-containing protein [Saccharomonospora azurea]
MVGTAEHPFWVDDQGRWLNADELMLGDYLVTAARERFEVVSIEHRTEIRRVRNLTINGIYTYHVMAGVTPVLVHNSGPDCGVPIGGRNGDRLAAKTFMGIITV